MPLHTFKTLTEDLEKSGLKRDDTILIHSSMKSMGEVEGRADTVLDVLMDYFGKDGLLVFPTLSYSNVNADQPIFDVRSTPSVVGILSQLFWQRPNVWRSLHPTHSVAAYGSEALPFVEGHERSNSPANSFSPWRKLILAKAKIMFLGTSICYNTFLHGVEEWGKAEDSLCKNLQELYVIDYNGVKHPCFQHLYTGGHWHYYDRLAEHFKYIGAWSECTFGDAHYIILDAPKIARYVISILAKYPATFTKKWNVANPTFFQDIYKELTDRG